MVSTETKTLYMPLVNYANQIVGYKQINSDAESTFPSKQCQGLLHCSPYKKKTDSAVIVQRLVDFLALCNSNLNYNIICLPNGKCKIAVSKCQSPFFSINLFYLSFSVTIIEKISCGYVYAK